MPQSLANVYIHLIFSTKNRVTCLGDDVRSDLHSYMSTVLANIECPTVLINSVENHMQVLFRLGRTVAVSKVVEEVKKSSSKWLKSQSPELSQFSWQSGYGAFSVSESNAPQVANYIRNQEEHHRTKTFQEEYREFLDRHAVSPPFLWLRKNHMWLY